MCLWETHMCKRWIFQQSMFDYQRVHVSNRSCKSKLSHCHSWIIFLEILNWPLFQYFQFILPRRRIPVPFIKLGSRRRRCHGPPRLPSVGAMGVCVAKPATCRDGPSPQGDGRKSLGGARGWWGELGLEVKSNLERTVEFDGLWNSDLICFWFFQWCW